MSSLRSLTVTPGNPKAPPGSGDRAGPVEGSDFPILKGETNVENDLFEWSGWDLISDTILQFYGCKLKVSIGRFTVGETVPIIVVNFETGVLQLHGKARAGFSKDTLLSEHKVRLVLAD